MRHYTYLLQHTTEDLRYIGVRSCTCSPIQDINYWGSSKHTPKDIRQTHVKIILREHQTREQALRHEVELHELNDVGISPQYYNKAKQTSTGFDTTGTTLSASHRAKTNSNFLGRTHTDSSKALMSKNRRGIHVSEESKKKMSTSQKAYALSPSYKNGRTGSILLDSTKEKISKARKRAECDVGINNSRFKPWFISTPTVTHLFYHITKEDQSLKDGFYKAKYQDAYYKSKGVKAFTSGILTNCIVGNIP